MKIVIIAFFIICCKNVSAQCEIEITNVSVDSLSNQSKVNVLDGICVKYKTRGKNKLEIYANKELGETQEIIDVKNFEEYTELEVINRYGIVVKYRFYKNVIKVETFIFTNRTYIIEKGSGLSYKISKRIRTNRVSFSLTSNHRFKLSSSNQQAIAIKATNE